VSPLRSAQTLAARLVLGLLAGWLGGCQGSKGTPAPSDPSAPAQGERPSAPGRPAPSCAVGKPGAGSSCGPAEDIDCCASAAVSGGSFKRSFDGINCDDAGLPATVGEFELDVFEVTVGRFRAFLDAGGGTRGAAPAPGAGAHPKHPGSGWSSAWTEGLAESREELERALDCGPGATWTPAPGASETLPINCVTFHEALAFCAWDGGFLPTEAERNYAASGGEEQRVYPWSSPPDSVHITPAHAVFASPATAPVGTRRQGDGRWGHADLAGNVWEWTLDEVELAKVLPTEGANFCEPAGMPVPCTDCVATGVGTARVLRGGGWGLPERGMAVAIRRGGEPDERHHVFGIRCARRLGAGAAEPAAPAGCTPSCADRSCGDDGCGGSCGSCAALEYPPGPYGLGPGMTVPDLRVAAIRDATRDPERMEALAFAEYHGPASAEPSPRLAIYLTTGWASVDRSAELLAWAKTTANPPVEIVIVLLEGERRGQAADAGNLRQYAVSRALSAPVAMDNSGGLAPVIGDDPRPLLLLVARDTMKILAAIDPQDPAAWAEFAGRVDEP